MVMRWDGGQRGEGGVGKKKKEIKMGLREEEEKCEWKKKGCGFKEGMGWNDKTNSRLSIFLVQEVLSVK